MRKAFVALAALALVGFLAGPASAAKLYLSEYKSLGVTSNGVAPLAQEPSIADQVSADFSSAAQQLTFGNTTRYVRVICDAQCSILIGPNNPTATANNKPLGAMSPEYFAVNPGDQISVFHNP